MIQNEKPKLLLFDIDGTLISAHGIPRKAMHAVLQKRYPSFIYDTKFDFSGRTDWEIIEHLLHFGGVVYAENDVFEIMKAFTGELESALQNGNKPLIHPGVEILLDRLQKNSSAYLGLVTGNIVRGAQLKLHAAGLWDYFPVGGFGDDARVRNDLPAFAINRAKSFYKIDVQKKNTWIIGDSIYDVKCAKENKLRCLAVCTGWTKREKLSVENPEFLVDDLSRVDEIMEILLNS